LYTAPDGLFGVFMNMALVLSERCGLMSSKVSLKPLSLSAYATTGTPSQSSTSDG